jgi:hypothetical protein
MHIIFESRQPQANVWQEVAQQRVRFALRRIGSAVLRAKVRFTDINGPRGGVDKHCLLEVKTEKNGVLVVSTLANDWRVALNEALNRLVRTLTRTLQRQHRPLRGRMPHPQPDDIDSPTARSPK